MGLKSAMRIAPILKLTPALLILSGSACLHFVIKPYRSFDQYTPPPPPNYSNLKHWAARPERKDRADVVPVPELKDRQNQAWADVFYIHPTTYFNNRSWNARLDDERVNKRTDRGPIRHHGAVFNGAGRIYAPRYRQATLYHALDDTGSGAKARDLAYRDVRAAFIYYDKFLNYGRPIIIASHSQGSRHAVRLVREFFDADAGLRRRLVAAYIVGNPVSKKAFKNIQPCKSPEAVGCFISWNTYFRSGRPVRRGDEYTGALCVNPLTWKTDEQPADYSANRGGVPRGFNRLDKGVSDARCDGGILRISGPLKPGYPTMEGDSYHVMDYNLFFLNVRENVALRVKNWIKVEQIRTEREKRERQRRALRRAHGRQ